MHRRLAGYVSDTHSIMVKRRALFLLLSFLLLMLASACNQATTTKKKKLPGMSSEASQLPWSRPESWQGGGSRFGLPQYY